MPRPLGHGAIPSAGGAAISTLFLDLRLDRGAPTRLRVGDDGRVVETGPDLEPHSGEARVACGGALALPALVDAHAHLDKTLTGLPWHGHPAGPDRASRIATEKRLRGALALPVAERASRLLERCVGHGSLALRTHVDVDAEIGIDSVEAVAAVRERHAAIAELQIVAFPQSGLGSGRRVMDLLDAALGAGADLLGGIDPVAVDGEIDRPLDALFALAERRGVGLDLHLHDPTANGLAEIEGVCARASALDMRARVTVSHGFALGAAADVDFARIATAMADAGVTLVTHGGGASPLPPVRRLVAHGVTVAAGNDGVRDLWTPFGNGDMLERAMLLAWRSGFRTDADLALAFACASAAGAAVLGIEGGGFSPGARADFVTLDAENLPEAVVERPTRRLVVKGGRIVARDGRVVREA